VTYTTEQAIPIPDGISVRVHPLTVERPIVHLNPGEALEARFETSLESLSAFLVVEASRDGDDTTRFLLPCRLVNAPEHRSRLLLRMMIGSADRFLRYLLALLSDDQTSDVTGAIDALVDEGTSANDEAPGAAMRPVLETMLRTMRRDPARILATHPIVSDLADEDILPEGFLELWNAVYAVCRLR
jgi:hypothetical protein